MDDGTGSSSQLHVVICPWLAFGHLLPCLDLAERLASRGHRVSLVSTPRNIERLPPVHSAVAPLVGLVALPLPRVVGLPDGAESTHDVPLGMFDLHLRASDGLAAPFSEFLESLCAEPGRKKPDWIIVDYFNHWAAAAAIKHEVPCALLVLLAATVVAALDIRLSVSRSAGAPRLETAKTELISVQGVPGASIAERVTSTLERCNLVAMRSCVEWEPESVPLAATFGGKPVVAFGLLPPSPDGGRRGDSGKDGAAVRWLDAQPAQSVVYVALGSEVLLRPEEVHELAHGLELGGTRFLWALRKPPVDADVVLPAGFEERTRGHGLVMNGWVPQLEILAHDAVSVSLTHCGWNSTIEGLLFGRPLVMLPIMGDQEPNARLMERRKVGVQVPRNQNDGSFDREGVAAAIRAVAVEEEGRRVFTANAKKLQEIVSDTECHERYIDRFIQQLRCYK
uniref:Uncharacterized protein n=1 Tax=Avena sativa TaxID=4498 RepID=A0ACD5Y8N2_AVESA